MGFRKALWGAGCGVAFLSALYAFQRPFRQFPGVEYENFEIPADWRQNGESDLRAPDVPPVRTTATPDGSTEDWREGLSLWTQDYPRADRHFSLALRRLTRVQCARSNSP